MKPLNFSLPTGWTYSALRQFLQSELQEDKPGATAQQSDSYLSLTDFDDTVVVYSIDWDGPTYQLGYTISNAGAGPDAVWSGDPIEVAQKITYVPVAEMAARRTETPPEHAVVAFSTPIDTFALGDDLNASDADWVVRSGVIFVAGEYPDKAEEYGLESLVVAADDLKAMVQSFTPVENRVSHVNGGDKGKTPTIFDNHMGRLESVWVDESGDKLYGAVRIPKFLDDFQKHERGGGPLQASIEFDFVTKQILGNTIVPNPRVETSALMSACAAFSTRNAPEPEEKPVMGKTPEQVKEAETVSLAEFTALKARNEAQERQLAEMARVQRDKDAVAFADTQLRSGKFPASARPYLIAAFTTAAEDDANTPKTINFAIGEQTVTANRVQTLEAMAQTIPALLTREFVPGQDNIVLPFANDSDEAKENEKVKAQANAFVEQQVAARNRNGR